MAANAYLYFLGLALIQSAAVDYNNMLTQWETGAVKTQNVILGSIATIALIASAFIFRWYYPFIGLITSTLFYGVTRPLYRSFVFAHQLAVIVGIGMIAFAIM